MKQKLSFKELTCVLDCFFGRYSDRKDEILLLEDLTLFGIHNRVRLCVLIGKHWDRLLDEQRELRVLIEKATAGFMPSCNDCSYTRAGLVRVAMQLEFGRAWWRYVQALPVVRKSEDAISTLASIKGDLEGRP
jgi:hypothetical protein